jgi:acyl carrier protein
LDLREKYIKLLSDHFKQPEIFFKDSTIANDISGWDSLAQAELILRIEHEFRIEFSLRDLMQMSDVGRLFDLIANKK